MVSVPKLEDDKGLRDLQKKREHLTKEVAEIGAELRDHGQDAPHLRDKRQKLGERLHAAQEEAADVGRALQQAKRRVGASAGAQFGASSGYQKLLGDALHCWVERMAPWLALDAATSEARRRGILIQPLPPVVAFECEQVAGWVAQAVRRGVVDVETLPKAIKELVKDDR